MASLCHFPPVHSTQSLSKLFSHSKFPVRNLELTFSKLASNLQRISPLSSSSTIASTSAFIESDSAVSASLGDVVRPDFPILHQTINGNKLVYLDNAATSQKPSAVLKVLNESHSLDLPNGNMSANTFDAYEVAREKVAAFINAVDSSEIVFTSNATEAINMVAYSWGLSNLKSGDEIVLTVAEHHSNIVPWQLIAQRTGATLKFVGLTEEVPNINLLKNLISEKTKLVVTHHVSNMLGSIMPINEIVSWSHSVGAKVLVDACQSVPHMVVDVQKLDADFLVASSHKMCGPTGVGFLYGKKEMLSEMTPLDGSEMFAYGVQANSTSARSCPRLETGTPPIAQAIGLGAAIDYMSSIGMQKIHDYETELANYLYQSLLSIPNVHIYGPVPSETVKRAALCSFTVENIHPTDIATFLDEQHGVAIRSGHHCAQLLHRSLGINASARASLHFYNTKEEVDTFIHALKDTINFFTSYL